MASNDLVKYGLLAGIAWAGYEWVVKPMLGSSSGTPAAGGSAPPAPPAVTGANSLDGIHAQVLALAKADNAPASLGVDQWGYYLNQALSKAGKGAAPDPMPIFSAAISGFDRSQPLTDAQYWGIMAPALQSQLGLTGLGLYAGFSAMARRYGY